MARTVIEDSGPAYVDDSSGPALGMIVGLLLAAVIVVLAVLFFRGTFDSGKDTTPQAPGNNGTSTSAPSSEPSSAPSSAPSP